jgi:hypothetical protein
MKEFDENLIIFNKLIILNYKIDLIKYLKIKKPIKII